MKADHSLQIELVTRGGDHMLVRYAERTVTQDNYKQSRVFQILGEVICSLNFWRPHLIPNILCYFLEFLAGFEVDDQEVLEKFF